MDDFATRLRALRLERGLAVEEVANMLMPRTTGRTWSKWENRREEPKLANFRSLCSFFDVSGDYLLGWSDVRGKASKTDAGDASVPPGERSEISDEVASAGDARRQGRSPKPARPGSSRRPAS